MRISADWMTLADDRILEYVSKYETATPSEMAESDLVRFKRVHLQRRCQKLARYGLLRQVGNGVYMLSDAGQEYLSGDLDAATLEQADET